MYFITICDKSNEMCSVPIVPIILFAWSNLLINALAFCSYLLYILTNRKDIIDKQQYQLLYNTLTLEQLIGY